MKNKRQEFIWIDLGACIYPTQAVATFECTEVHTPIHTAVFMEFGIGQGVKPVWHCKYMPELLFED